jgi:hypothetical protein
MTLPISSSPDTRDGARAMSAQMEPLSLVTLRKTVCTHLEKRRDPNIFSAVPAKAGTQSHALRSSGLKLLDARFRGQGEAREMASARDLYPP